MVAPPQVLTRTEYVPLPAACYRLRGVELPSGTSAQQIIERQNAVLKAYREQITDCAQAKATAK